VADSGGETPVPIPNTAVKPSSADGTSLARGWESRSLPGFFSVVFFLMSHRIKRVHEHNGSSNSGLRITLIGILINVFLLVAKLVGGALAGSVALIADGVHSTSDLATDLVVLGGMRLGTREADANHAYGHGKYETIAGGLVAAVLIFVGFYIAWNAGAALYAHRESYPGGVVLLVIATVSILFKEWLYRRTEKISRKVGSAALHANAWHHRSDALSSVAVLMGGAATLLGWGHADQVAGIIVGLMVVSAGGKTVAGVFHELSEGSLSSEQLRTIETAIGELDSVHAWHRLRTRQVGREFFIDVHVLVDSNLSFLEAHRVSMEVENAVERAFDRPVNIVVHVEPDTPELAEHHLES
jgi:cation diffusion facilitator family transporter